jgi:hypothetical protein
MIHFGRLFKQVSLVFRKRKKASTFKDSRHFLFTVSFAGHGWYAQDNLVCRGEFIPSQVWGHLARLSQSHPGALLGEAFAQSDAQEWTDTMLSADVTLYLPDGF